MDNFIDNNKGTLKELSQYRLKRANIALEQGKEVLEKDLRLCLNRTYYAVFYAIRAVITLEFKDFKKHKDIIAYFNKNFIATKKILGIRGREIANLQGYREKADYDDFYLISKTMVLEQLSIAEKIIKIIEQYLSARYKKSDI